MPCKQYFKIGSNVILTRNIWKEAGLFNGSKGKIVDFILREDHSLKFMLIKFDNFKGRGWNGTDLVAVTPIEIQHNKNS